MGFLKPRIETRQPRSQATPLAGDVLGLLRKEITGGTFGEGLGPLQREAGTGIRQFVNSGGGRFDFSDAFGTDFFGGLGVDLPEIRDPLGMAPVRDVGVNLGPRSASLEGMLPALEAVHRRRSEEQVADLREGFGAAGTRFGTSLARGEADLRGNLESDFMAQLSSLLPVLDQSRRADAALGLQGQQLGVQRDLGLNQVMQGLSQLLLGRDVAAGQQELAGGDLALRTAGARAGDQLAREQTQLGAFENELGRLMAGLQLMQMFGGQNILPFLQFGSMGILPEDTVVTDSPWKTGLELLGQLMQGAGAVATGMRG